MAISYPGFGCSVARFSTAILLLIVPTFLMAQQPSNGAALLAHASTSSFSGGDATTTTPNPTEAVTATAQFEAQKGYLPAPLADGILVLEKSFGGLGMPEGDDEAWMPLTTILEITNTNKVRAVASGRVSAVIPLPEFGNVVMVRHGEYLSVYSMLKAAYVKEGATITQGQVLGVVGKGYDEGLLHFELRRDKEQVNPLKWIEPSQFSMNSQDATFRIR